MLELARKGAGWLHEYEGWGAGTSAWMVEEGREPAEMLRHLEPSGGGDVREVRSRWCSHSARCLLVLLLPSSKPRVRTNTIFKVMSKLLFHRVRVFVREELQFLKNPFKIPSVLMLVSKTLLIHSVQVSVFSFLRVCVVQISVLKHFCRSVPYRFRFQR